MNPWILLCVINLKKVFKFTQKRANLQRNSTRGVTQIGPKTIVMVLLVTEAWKWFRSKWVNQKECHFRGWNPLWMFPGICCHWKRNAFPGEHGEPKNTHMAWGVHRCFQKRGTEGWEVVLKHGTLIRTFLGEGHCARALAGLIIRLAKMAPVYSGVLLLTLFRILSRLIPRIIYKEPSVTFSVINFKTLLCG